MKSSRSEGERQGAILYLLPKKEEIYDSAAN